MEEYDNNDNLNEKDYELEQLNNDNLNNENIENNEKQNDNGIGLLNLSTDIFPINENHQEENYPKIEEINVNGDDDFLSKPTFK